MKILSWNVNGLRAVLKKDFHGFLKKYKPDVLGLQEIKIDKDAIKEAQFDFPDYQEFYNPARRKGYAGTALLVRCPPRPSGAHLPEGGDLEKGSGAHLPEGGDFKILSNYKWDDEGRVQILDLGKFYIANIYFPNANHELSRLDFKIKFNDRLLKEFKKLKDKKPLLVMGDYNVAHQPIDLARPKENEGNPGYHPRERAWMDKFLDSGFVDIYRSQNPDTIKYSWWSFRARARERNVGWRIDYVCVSDDFKNKVNDTFILNEVTGSDHCPVGVEIK